jgi:hypothetical protein
MEFTPQQEITRKQDGPAAENSAVEAGQGPAAMSNWPLLQFVEDLEGFDFAALLLGLAVVFFSVGFAIDYLVGRYGMGPYWNGFYAIVGAYAGLCVRDWWLQPYAAYDPYLATIVVAGGLLTTVVMVSAVAKR